MKKRSDTIHHIVMVFILLILTPAVLFSAGQSERPSSEQIQDDSRELEKPTAAVSILPMRYFVERIAGDSVETLVIVPPGKSPATYEPSPRQVAELGKAEVLFTIGVPFEESFLPVLEQNVPELPVIDATEGIRKRPIQSSIAHEEEDGDGHGHEHEGGRLDPHVWLSPPLAEILAQNIMEGLVRILPDQENMLRANYQSLIKDLEDLDRQLKVILAPVQGMPILVYHPSFGYFAEAYGVRQLPIELGGNEPSPKQLQEIINLAQEKGVKVIFVQPEFSKTSALRVAEAIDGVVVEVAPLKPQYLENMTEIAGAIRSGLEKNRGEASE